MGNKRYMHLTSSSIWWTLTCEHHLGYAHQFAHVWLPLTVPCISNVHTSCNNSILFYKKILFLHFCFYTDVVQCQLFPKVDCLRTSFQLFGKIFEKRYPMSCVCVFFLMCEYPLRSLHSAGWPFVSLKVDLLFIKLQSCVSFCPL